MINVVADADVFSKELFAHAIVQAGALVFQRGSGEIVKKKPDKIEHRRGLEDHRVTSRRKLAGVDGKVRLLAGSRGEFLWIKGANIRGVRFGPARGGAILRGNGKLGVRFAISCEEAPGISQSGLALAVRIDSGSDLASLDGQVTGAPTPPRSFLGGESGRLFAEAVYPPTPLPSGHRQKPRSLPPAPPGARPTSYSPLSRSHLP